nr:MAG TPA: hypothetical protein [Caudoviricetes sp.]
MKSGSPFFLIVRECSLTFGMNYSKPKNKMQHFFKSNCANCLFFEQLNY